MKILKTFSKKVVKAFMKFIIGKKIEMTQVWQGDKVMAVTKVAAGPCPVVQVKTTKSKTVIARFSLVLMKEKKKMLKNHRLAT